MPLPYSRGGRMVQQMSQRGFKDSGLIFALLVGFGIATAGVAAGGEDRLTTGPAAVAREGGSAHASSFPGGIERQVVPLKIKLPFPAGVSYEVIQGNHGTFTHSGFNSYAWDFAMPENAPVVAAASGRVVRVKQDGAAGGPSHEFFSQGNTIILDHGDGYYTQYLHLAQNSARVKEGQLVFGGEVIALSGNTGFSSMPHLHFQVQDATGRSLPAKFEDVAGGIPKPDTFVTSGNDGRGISPYGGESWLPTDVFKPNDVVLLSRNLPGHLFRRGQNYRVRGRITGREVKKAAIYFMAATGGRPLQTIYARVDREGFFEADLSPEQLLGENWSAERNQSNMFSLAIAPVEDDGSFWSEVSIPVCIR